MAAYVKPGEIASLTGLRGLACLLVVVAHYAGWSRVTPDNVPLPDWMGTWLSTAQIGMNLFFTLSGFVIALSYSHWDWRHRPIFSLVRLFFYRFARLYPAFFVFVLLIVLQKPILQDFSDQRAQDYLIPHVLLWQSWWPFKFEGIQPAAGFFHVSWSLSSECALYFMFGLGAIAAAALPRWRHKPLILGAAFFMSVPLLLYAAWLRRSDLTPLGWTDQEWMDWLLRISPYGLVALQFGTGVVAFRISSALSKKGAKTASDVGAAALVAGYFLVVAANRHSVPALPGSIMVTLATALLMIGAQSDSIANRLLSGRSIVYVGTISYSLYLFHFLGPALLFHGQYPTFTLVASAYHAANFAFAFAFAVMIATGIYTVVEVPGRRAIRAAADRIIGIAPTTISPPIGVGQSVRVKI